VVEQNIVYDVGRDAPGENGCAPATTYWQDHDQGIYYGEGDNVVIASNVFYDLTHGWAIQRYDSSGATVNNVTIVNNTFVGANPNKGGKSSSRAPRRTSSSRTTSSTSRIPPPCGSTRAP
jgi:hypothetical protein